MHRLLGSVAHHDRCLSDFAQHRRRGLGLILEPANTHHERPKMFGHAIVLLLQILAALIHHVRGVFFDRVENSVGELRNPCGFGR